MKSSYKTLSNKLADLNRMKSVTIPTPEDRRAKIENNKKEEKNKLNETIKFNIERDVVAYLQKNGINGVQGKDVNIVHGGNAAWAVHRGLSSDKNYGRYFSINKAGEVTKHGDLSSALDKINESYDDLDEMAGYTNKTIHKELKNLGWTLDRTKGGHAIYEHENSSKNIAVPLHSDELARQTAQQILKTASLVNEEVETLEEMSKKDDPCWNGYSMLGTKDKGGKKVPNCVKDTMIESPSSDDWSAHSSLSGNQRRKPGHYLQNSSGKIVSDHHTSSDHALKTFSALPDHQRKGVKIIHIKEDIQTSDYKLDKNGNKTKRATITFPNNPAQNVTKYLKTEIKEEIKVGTLVKPKYGPFKGETHEVIGNNSDGTHSIRLVSNKYKQDKPSFAKLSKHQFDLVEGCTISEIAFPDALKLIKKDGEHCGVVKHLSSNTLHHKYKHKDNSITLIDAKTLSAKHFKDGKIDGYSDAIKELCEVSPSYNINHEYVKNELSKKDINSSITGKKSIVVHKDNIKSAKAHLKTIGMHNDYVVTGGLNEDEQFDNIDSDIMMEAVPSYMDFLGRVIQINSNGHKVLDSKHTQNRAHITMVDSEGMKKTLHYTPNGTKMENHGKATGDEMPDVTSDNKKGRGRPIGSKSGASGLQVK